MRLFIAINGPEHVDAMKKAGYPADRIVEWDILDGADRVEQEFPRITKKIDAILGGTISGE